MKILDTLKRASSVNLHGSAELIQRQATTFLEDPVTRDGIPDFELEEIRDLLTDALARVNVELLRRQGADRRARSGE